MDLFESALISRSICKQREEYTLFKDSIDLSFIRFFYWQGLKMLAYRTEGVNVSFYNWMCDTVNSTVPDWRNNRYVEAGLNGFYYHLLTLIDLKLTQNDFDDVLEMIRESGF